MSKHEELMKEYLITGGIDSRRAYNQTLTRVREIAAGKQALRHRIKQFATGCSFLGIIFCVLAWRIWHTMIIRNSVSIRELGHYKPESRMIFYACLIAATIALVTGVSIWLTLAVKHRLKLWQMKYLEANLPHPEQLIPALTMNPCPCSAQSQIKHTYALALVGTTSRWGTVAYHGHRLEKLGYKVSIESVAAGA